MRVGLVCPYDWDVPGGVKAHVKDLAEELLRQGHEVSVLAPLDDDASAEPYVVPGGRSVAVKYNGSVARLNFGVNATGRVRRWIRDGEFDVLHVHEPAAPSLSVLACWVANGPVVGTFHTSNPRSRVMSAAYGLLQTALEKLSARIAVSEAARRTLVEHLGGDAVLIPNGVSCRTFAHGEPLPGYPVDGGSLMFIGRIDEPRKGLPVLLDALPALVERHPSLRLLVAGPGDVDEVRKELAPRPRDHVEFLGLVSDADKVRAFHSADVYVAPNTGGESFGIVLLEAMASGTPVLASDLDAFDRVLDHGRAGVMFANGDSADLSARAGDLLADPARRSVLAVAGRERAAVYDWERVAREIVDVYDSVTVTGVPVQCDLRGQLVGRLAKYTRSGDDRPGEPS